MYLQKLIPLLNLPIIGKIFRRLLWIDDYKNKIVKLLPNTYHIQLDSGKFQTTIYINNQYDEAARKHFGWILSFLHNLDTLLINRLRPSWNLGFDTYTSQPAVGKDVWLHSTAPDTNQDGDGNLIAGEANTNVIVTRSLLQFDFSSIPSDSIASSAVGSLWQYAEFSDFTRVFSWYRCKRVWVANQATWNSYSTGNAWGTAGADNTTSDRDATAIGTLSMTATEAAGEKQWSLTTALIQDMWDGDFTNNGFVIRCATETDDRQDFRASEYATAGERPKMVIVYFVPPTPGVATAGAGTPTISFFAKQKLTFPERDTELVFDERDTTLKFEDRDTSLTFPRRKR